MATQRRGQVGAVAALAASIESALIAGGSYLDPELVSRGRSVLDRSVQRLEHGTGHTVVALAGATGSGKSSLFNALAGMDIAEVGVRRPMTREPMSVVWGEGGDDLLDWLQVPPMRRMRRESVLDADREAVLGGLILLDLPDHDSTEIEHRLTMDRLVSQVDLLIWVLDPQKYADDALHSGYLRPLAGHADAMLVVLNQVDRLGVGEAETCYRDLRRLLDSDGLQTVQMLGVSATRGDGVEHLRDLLAQTVQHREAVANRTMVDLVALHAEIEAAIGVPDLRSTDALPTHRLVDELAHAAGVPAVLDALTGEYRRQGWARTASPMLAPLLRGAGGVERAGRDRQDPRDLRSSATALRPTATSAQRAQVQLCLDRILDEIGRPLQPRWADGVRAAVQQPEDDFTAALDVAVASVDLELDPPAWWGLVAAGQWALTAITAFSAAWLFVLVVAGLTGGQVPGSMVAGVPVPLVTVLLGMLAAAATSALSAAALGSGARRRRDAAEGLLLAAVEEVAAERVLHPVRGVLAVHHATANALRAATPAHPDSPAQAGPSGSSTAAPEPAVPVSAPMEPPPTGPVGQPSAQPAAPLAVDPESLVIDLTDPPLAQDEHDGRPGAHQPV